MKDMQGLYIEKYAAAAAAAKSFPSFPTLCDLRRQPTRLPRPWDSPGKNSGVGCHLLLQCMKVKSESEVAESCPTLSDPMDCSPPGSSIHRIFQGRVLEWGCLRTSPQSNICFIQVLFVLVNPFLLHPNSSNEVSIHSMPLLPFETP